MYKINMQCTLCENKSDEESEAHLLKCTKILENAEINPAEISSASYEQIFSQNIEEQIKITKVFSKILKVRSILLKRK